MVGAEAALEIRVLHRHGKGAREIGTTGEVPAERLVMERAHLQPVPTPYDGRSIRSLQVKAFERPIVGLQHPLSLYDAFAGSLA
jgi:hypothetical protein